MLCIKLMYTKIALLFPPFANFNNPATKIQLVNSELLLLRSLQITQNSSKVFHSFLQVFFKGATRHVGVVYNAAFDIVSKGEDDIVTALFS